ncbi:hypothetical protein V6N12_020556 [Hibiscus sabdariffa]|uniref:Uncharacterized protein n=1 Tax=Hibiscus sabdariffa TaxID=183260 RepID=A0ABR2CYG2_9ROSI
MQKDIGENHTEDGTKSPDFQDFQMDDFKEDEETEDTNYYPIEDETKDVNDEFSINSFIYGIAHLHLKFNLLDSSSAVLFALYKKVQPHTEDDEAKANVSRAHAQGSQSVDFQINVFSSRQGIPKPRTRLEEREILKPPPPMKPRDLREQSDKRCVFHNDQGHCTDNCIYLRNTIEFDAKRSQLDMFMVSSRDNHQDQRESIHGASGSRFQTEIKTCKYLERHHPCDN